SHLCGDCHLHMYYYISTIQGASSLTMTLSPFANVTVVCSCPREIDNPLYLIVTVNGKRFRPSNLTRLLERIVTPKACMNKPTGANPVNELRSPIPVPFSA